MAKVKTTGSTRQHYEHTPKKTKQGGRKPKRSTMNRDEKRNAKPYRGQGR